MEKKPYLPFKDSLFSNWLGTLAANISTYATKYGITAPEVTFIGNAAAFYAYWFAQLANIDQVKQGVTKFKNEVRRGVNAGGSPSVQPTGITFAAVPTAVPPGVEATIRSIAVRIKGHQSYTTADGEVLGIEGDEHNVDINTLKPVFKIVMQAGHPNLVWTKGISSGVKIKTLRNFIPPPVVTPPPPIPPIPSPAEPESGFKFLATDTQPDYLDTTPLPSFGQSSVWAYIMIYMINDEEVGQWSDVVFVTVTGTP